MCYVWYGTPSEPHNCTTHNRLRRALQHYARSSTPQQFQRFIDESYFSQEAYYATVAGLGRLI